MARNPKVELRGHEGQVVHPITDGDCVIFPSGETLSHKLSEQEEVMYAPEVTNSSPMFKVGEGDSSDYSANVLDGAYQEAVLKGQTYVNTIQEPSADVITLPTPFTEYERTQSKTFTEMQDGTFGLNLVGQSYVNCIQEPSEPSCVALGENLEFQNKKVEYTTDGQIKSAMLNGMTLVNWCTYSTKLVTLSREHRIFNLISPNRTSLQQNKDYLIVVDVISLNTPVTTLGLRLQIGNTYITIADNRQVGLVKYKFNTGSNQNLNGNNLRLYITNEDVANENFKCSFRNVMILEYQEGLENIDIPYFQGMQSVTMTTELENVCSRYNSSAAKNGKTFTVGSTDTRTLKLSPVANIGSYNFKQNTKYLLQFKIANLNLDGLDAITFYFSEGDISGGNALFGNLANASMSITKNGIYRIVLTTSNIVNTSGFVIKGIGSQWENSTSTTRTLTISQIMCIEYQNGMENWDLPYFETTQLMKPVQIESVNKNLCYGTWATGSNGVSTMDNYFRVQEGEYYRISHQGTRDGSSCHFYDRSKNLISTLNGEVVQAPSGAYYGRWAINIDTQYLNTIQIEESNIGGNATPYIPHQSKTISALEPITLRAIGDVKDTLDLSTGEYVQRIGEITFTSDNENYQVSIDEATPNITHIRLDEDANKYAPNQRNGRNPLTNIIPNNPINRYSDNTEGIYVDANGILVLCLSREKATTVDEFKTWLVSNPITVQYELENPITRKISLEYPNLQTYQDITHVQSIAMDGTLIPKIFLPSDISYKAMLKPNTSYNVIVDREVISSDNQLTVNLGGTTANITANRTVITTPSTLSNETLTFSGKDNRIAKAMLIEGGTLINGDLPHFDGIGDVKLGRVVENLCMANEKFAGGGSVTGTYYNDRIELKITKAGSAVAYFPLTKQLKNGKKYFVYSPSTTSNTQTVPIQVSFKRTYNNSTNYSQQVTDMSSSGKLIFEINDKNTNPYDSIVFGNHGNIPVNTTMTIRRPILCEYIDGMENWDWESIGYFTGTRNIGNEFMRISNSDKTKHNSLHILPDEQIPLTFEQGAIYYTEGDTWANAINNTATHRIRTRLLDLEPNETYRISCGHSNYAFGCQGYNNDLLGKSDSGWTYDEYYFTTTKDVHKYAIVIRNKDESNLTPSELHQVRLEKVTDVTLRSVGDVKDELDLTRGVYIQRMYEVKLNGFEDWSMHNEYSTDNHLCFYWGYKKIPSYDYNKFGQWYCAMNVTPLLIPRGWNSFYGDNTDEEGVTFNGDNKQNITIKIRKDRLSSQDVNGFKQWLQSNPITVQYPLETPIEHKINIPMKNESNQTIAKPNGIFTLPLMYSETNHVDINSQIYPKVESRDYISYPVIANNSQLHTVFHNKLGTGNLTVNLCGTSVTSVDGTSKCTITTPSTISQYELRLSGARNKVSNVCVFSGDYMNVNVPYVQGMMNAVNPTVKNVGKNLFDLSYIGDYNNWISNSVGISYNNYPYVEIQLKPNTDYVFTRNSINNPSAIGTQNHTAVHTLERKNDVNWMYHHEHPSLNNKTVYIRTSNSGVLILAISTCTNQNILTNIMQGFSEAIIEEASTPSQYEPYKENICQPDYGEILSKNMFEQGSIYFTSGSTFTSMTSNIDGTRVRTKQLLELEVGKTYVLKTHGTMYFTLSRFNNDEKGVKETGWTQSTTIIPTQDINKYGIAIKSNSLKLDAFNISDITLYELDKEITLRSLPNGVRDELNLQTGEYIQRIGEVVFDGSSDEVMWFNSGWTNGDSVACYWNVNEMGLPNKNPGIFNVVCHSFPTNIGVFGTSNDIVGEAIWGEKNSNVIYISIKKTKLPELNTNGFRQWASQNPITVQYELATPIVKQVDINNFPHSYKDGHVIIESNDPSTNVTAQMTYQCVANRTGQIQEHTEQVEKQEHEINELEMLILENIRQQQNR